MSSSHCCPGGSFVDIVVPNGQSSFSFYAQGVTGASGTATLTATTPLFTTDTATVAFYPVRVTASPPSSTTTLAANSGFAVTTEIQYSPGCPSCWQYSGAYGQFVSAGAGPLTVTRPAVTWRWRG